MRARIRSMVAVGLLVLLFSSCSPAISPPAGTPVPDVDNTTPWQELCTREVDIHTFLHNYCLEYAGKIDQTIYHWQGSQGLRNVAADIGVECLRKTEGNALYSIHKVKQGGLLYLFFEDHNSENPKMIRWFYLQKQLHEKDFSTLQPEDSYDAVKAVDPTAQVIENCILASTQKDFTWASDHYTRDGIVRISVTKDGNSLKIKSISLIDDYFMADENYDVIIPCYGEILPMDWPE